MYSICSYGGLKSLFGMSIKQVSLLFTIATALIHLWIMIKLQCIPGMGSCIAYVCKGYYVCVST